MGTPLWCPGAGFLISCVFGTAQNPGNKKSSPWEIRNPAPGFLISWVFGSAKNQGNKKSRGWISHFLVFMSPGGLCSKSARVSELARSCAVFAAKGGALHWPKGEAEAVEDQ